MFVVFRPTYWCELSGPVVFHGPEILVGRGDLCDLQLEDPKVSRMHCSVHARNGQVLVEDLESLNGTFINGKRVHGRQELHDGDYLGLAASVVSVEISGDSSVIDRPFEPNNSWHEPVPFAGSGI